MSCLLYSYTHYFPQTNTNGFHELDSLCGKQGNFTLNSAYEKNLNDALLALAEAPTGNGVFSRFSNSTQDNESNSNTAYALAICPGIFQNDTCLGCVRAAPNRLKLECPNQKKATAWFFRTCILSYSNSSLNTVDGDDEDVISFPENYIPNWDFVVETLMNLLKKLRVTAVTDGYIQTFYTGSENLPSSRGDIKATMQCIPTISHNKCEECLGNATEYLLASYNGSTDGLVYYRYSCLIRYIIYIVNVVDVSPPMPPTNSPRIPPTGKKRSKVIIPVVAVAAVTLAISTFFICLKVRRIGSRKEEEEELFEGSDDDTGEIIYFRLNTIQAATRNFSDANKLGEGGFGSVYWGTLSDGKKIAVKRLSQNSSQGMKEFKTEVKLIITLQHKNLVKLLGCCMKGKERLLVYEYMSNSSLDKYLFDPKKAKELDWAKRVNIVNGIAKGLRYLHEDSRLKIIHRDLKASNVLLDDDINPKISDFGTARIFGSNQMEANTNRVVGTYGYMAPEYAMEGLFSIKSDVYSFGVLLLEIISGKRNCRLFYEEHDQNLLYYAWMLWEEGKGEQLIDENLNDDCPVDEGLKWMRIALLCVEEDPNDRPTMSSVAFMLEGEWKSLSDPKPPMSFSQLITFDNFSSTWNGDEFGFYSANET
ncbi:unnamed protein product [Lactuca saligna]|uniref:non-specific serine/threonine protein kinase n=1 Tax=Lactuca saligna TaxID=75948 RepID=A0AA35Y9I6_LACSI|nr:unnamed protein product [Lactuca saligna]